MKTFQQFQEEAQTITEIKKRLIGAALLSMPFRGCGAVIACRENISSIFHQKINGEPQYSSPQEDPTAMQWRLH